MIPNEICVTSITPKVEARGAALENQSLEINVKKIIVNTNQLHLWKKFKFYIYYKR